ncbi:MAG TPA: chloride channel protein [Solirubrobacteraceae bacterium]|nr:chloride channel protein [Solirubrobacteraceae bacterium]
MSRPEADPPATPSQPRPAPPANPAPSREKVEHLGDFTLTPRTLAIIALAMPVGAAGAGAAFVLLGLIGLITNLVFAHRLDTRLIAPGAHPHSAALILLAPVAGGLIIGLMARFGSEKIRGHGMPEALEAILIRGSRVEPKLAVLKPASAAVSIGTGGPFGAEGPIIMTGGAVGSLLAQLLHVTVNERKTLMVAGAAAGMAATFDAPLASILLAVELLLFEFKPRSLAPVTAAVITATLLRVPLIGHGPLFYMALTHLHLSTAATLECIPAGAAGGLLAIAATRLIYASEDAFGRLPLHWMWWPAIGGLIIGVGGLIEPRALGVGYDVIRQLLSGHAGMSLIIGILVVKTLIWGLSIGSGTSAGVLAPTFMIGAALGALEGHVLPGVTPGFWALVGLAAVVGGVMRSPLTGVVFPLELTHAWPLIVPLIIASVAAHTLSSLVLKRSVLTEKIARRGLHISREYATDPLEMLLVDEVMHGDPVVASADESLAVLLARTDLRRQWLVPVVDDDGRLSGVIPRGRLLGAARIATGLASEFAEPPRVQVFPDETLRSVAGRLADARITSAVVLAREDPERIVGMVTVEDLLQGRLRDLVWDRDRERVLRPRLRSPRLRPSVSPARFDANIEGDHQAPVG